MSKNITLLTDWGTRDANVSRIKAILINRLPGVAITDLSHDVPRHDIREAAYLLMHSYRNFPKGSIHVVPVGIFATGADIPGMVLAEKDGHYFLAPDNGLLFAMPDEYAPDKAYICRQYQNNFTTDEWLNDALATIGMAMKGGQVPLQETQPFRLPQVPQPQVSPIGVACSILRKDRYSNLTLNIRKEEFERLTLGRKFSIRTFRSKHITSVSEQYNDVAEKEPLCRFNKLNYLEIAVNHGSAMELFGIDPADPAALDFHSVRISLS
jgi:S-adenosyl-L-methionine hydrolase (adenosine-forming)